MNLARKAAQYILDDKGRKSFVILPVNIFEGLVEDFDDIEIAKSRRKEKKVSYDQMKKKLIKDGKLSS